MRVPQGGGIGLSLYFVFRPFPLYLYLCFFSPPSGTITDFPLCNGCLPVCPIRRCCLLDPDTEFFDGGYTEAVLGYALLKVPMLVGLLFQLLTAQVLIDIGRVLSTVSTLLMAGAIVYGFGATLAYRRARAA